MPHYYPRKRFLPTKQNVIKRLTFVLCNFQMKIPIYVQENEKRQNLFFKVRNACYFLCSNRPYIETLDETTVNKVTIEGRSSQKVRGSNLLSVRTRGYMNAPNRNIFMFPRIPSEARGWSLMPVWGIKKLHVLATRDPYTFVWQLRFLPIKGEQHNNCSYPSIPTWFIVLRNPSSVLKISKRHHRGYLEFS